MKVENTLFLKIAKGFFGFGIITMLAVLMLTLLTWRDVHKQQLFQDFSVKMESYIPWVSKEKRYENLLGKGEEFYKQKGFSEAASVYSRAIELLSDRDEAYVKLAQVYIEKKQFKDAENLGFKAPLTAKTKIYEMLGNSFFMAEDFLKAMEYYEKAVKGGDSNVNPDLELAIIKTFLKKGDTDSARSKLKTFMKQRNDNSLEILFLATLLSYDDVTEFNKYLSLLENKASKSSTDATSVNDFFEIRDIFGKSTEDILETRTLFAKLAINFGYPALTVDMYEGIVDFKQYWYARYYLGLGFYATGAYPEAIENFKLAIEYGSDSPWVYLYLARAYFAMQDDTNAVESYEKALYYSNGKDSEVIAVEYYEILKQLKKADETNAFLQNILSPLLSEDFHGVLKLAEIYSDTTSFSDVERTLKIIKKEDLESMSQEEKELYYELYCEYALETKNLDLAIRMLNKYETVNSKSAMYQYLLGRFYIEKGDDAEAKIAFFQAVDYDTSGEVTVLIKAIGTE